jgi:signal transduction histidine kinase
MWSLRTRFTLLLVVAVVLVLVAAAFVTAQLLRKPPEARFNLAMLEKAELAAAFLRINPEAAGSLNIPIGPRPAADRIDEFHTRILNEDRKARGYKAELIVLQGLDPVEHGPDENKPDENKPDGRNLAVHISGNQWAYLDFPPGPGPFPLAPLAAYLTLVAAGIIAIAVYASAVMMRPLRILDATIAKIRPDGVIPEIPETGPMEVRTTAQTINRLAARLNAAISSRMRLVAAAGHDLRTPMTRMRLRAEFVVDADERQSWLKDLDELDHIADSAIRLVREEVSPAAEETVQLDKVIEEIVSEIRETGLDVDQGPLLPAIVKGAPFALKRAIRNLVINAATHGKGAYLSLVQADDEAVILSIRDNGPGIPPHLLARVFEPFFRVDQARRQIVPGAGLGLAISREIIENNGGSVTIINSPEGGLLQTVRLPVFIAD